MHTFEVTPKPELLGAVPWIACADLEATLAFYESRLGFEREWTWGSPPTDAGLIRGSVRLYFRLDAALAARMADSEISIAVDEVDTLYREHQARGAPISMTIRDEPWGTREYHVRDPAGYVLRFSGESAEAANGAA